VQAFLSGFPAYRLEQLEVDTNLSTGACQLARLERPFIVEITTTHSHSYVSVSEWVGSLYIETAADTVIGRQAVAAGDCC